MYNRKCLANDKIVIEIDDKSFICSRKKLCTNSDYFYVMFNGNFTEKDKESVKIQEVTEKAFQNCLNMVDKKTNSLEYEEILDTLQCACMLQFNEIKEYCIKRLVNDLRLDYCLDVWQMTEFLDIHPLCEHAKCRALLEFNTLKDSTSILQVNLKQLHSYLANTLIYCDNELDIFDAGMKWWYENSPKLKESEFWTEQDTTKHLYTILSCVDFKSTTKSNINTMLTYPDIKDNEEIKRTLKAIISLIDDSTTTLDEEIEKQAKNLYFNSKPRDRILLDCVITSEYPWQPDQMKKTRLEREMNISYYDHKTKSMKKIFSGRDDLPFGSKCSPTLNGCKILPYKENLLLFGGENSYGSANWNNNIWLYHSFTNQWELLTKMPKERRHFNACIIDDKLFIIGGTGKYRIKLNDEMMIYDIKKNEWANTINLPYSWNEIRFCDYNGQLFVIPSTKDNLYAYAFCMKTYSWIKLTIRFPPNYKFDFTKNYCLFSRNNKIYAYGSEFLDMHIQGSNLKVTNVEKLDELYGDKMNYYINGNNLQIFTKHDTKYCIIIQLQCYNLTTKTNEILVQLNDTVDRWWHIRRGCFPFFHYSLAKDIHTITEFNMA